MDPITAARVDHSGARGRWTRIAATDRGARDAATEVMLHGALTLFRVRGIPIRAHWSLLLLLAYLAYAFSHQVARVAAGAGVARSDLVLPPLLVGAVIAVGLLVSVAVHELAHGLMAIRLGGEVEGVTLMLLGGVSQIGKLPRTPRAEALMAVAGPVTNFVLAGVLFLLHDASGHGPADPRMGLFYLAHANLVLGAFNLLPAFPMDGGRVLRAVLASRMGAARATDTAASVGKTLAILLGLAGLWTGALLLVVIAVFVYAAAGEEQRDERLRVALAPFVVRDVMTEMVATVDPELTLAQVARTMRVHGRREVVVMAPGAPPTDVISVEDLAAVPSCELASLRAGAALATRQRPRAIMVSPGEPLAEAIERAAALGATSLIAVAPPEQGPPRLLGLVSRATLDGGMVLAALGASRRLEPLSRPAPGLPHGQPSRQPG
jgi:Zn-dependent protease